MSNEQNQEIERLRRRVAELEAAEAEAAAIIRAGALIAAKLDTAESLATANVLLERVYSVHAPLLSDVRAHLTAQLVLPHLVEPPTRHIMHRGRPLCGAVASEVTAPTPGNETIPCRRCVETASLAENLDAVLDDAEPPSPSKPR